MNNWKVIPTIVLATVLIFGAGVFSGGILVDYVKQPHSRPPRRAPAAVPPNSVSATNPAVAAAGKPLKPPEILGKDFLLRLDGDLHLAKDQHEAIQKIINEGQNDMRKVVQDARLEIREVLTPAQRNQFDELVKRPFHKPIFETNMTFQARLQLLERQRTNPPAGEVPPQERMIRREVELTAPPSPLTNAP